jgi:glycerol uptake facilitator protein
MHSVWFGEYLGTLVLILLGNGVNANVTLRKSYAADAGWMVVATGWGLAVLCGVLVAQAFGSSGAHLNPAISFASAVTSGDYSHLLSLWSAQILGAMSGAALMTLHFFPHWGQTPDPAAKLGVFCTGPAIKAPLANIASEIIGTMVLVIVANAIFSHGVSATGPAAGVGQ